MQHIRILRIFKYIAMMGFYGILACGVVASPALAAKGDFFLATMRITRIVNNGGTIDYEVELFGGDKGILKAPPDSSSFRQEDRFSIGEAINYFVTEGLPENGLPTYEPHVIKAAYPFNNSAAIISWEQGKKTYYNYINKQGNILIPIKNPNRIIYASHFSDGVGTIRYSDEGNMSRKTVFVDPIGNSIEASNLWLGMFEHEIAKSPGNQQNMIFKEGLACAALTKDGKKWFFAVIDKNGKYKPMKHKGQSLSKVNGLGYFSEGLARINIPVVIYNIAEVNGCGFVNTDGELVINQVSGVNINEAGPFSNGLAVVWLDVPKKAGTSRLAVIDKNGKEVIDLQRYDTANWYFSENLLGVRDKESQKWAYIDKAGELKTNFNFTNVEPFSDGLALVRQSFNSWSSSNNGYIDTTGKIVIKTQYGNAQPFSEGLAAVSNSNVWQYIDKNGRVVIDSGKDWFYSYATPFSNGLALVKISTYGYKPTKWAYIDKTGKVVLWFF